MCRILFKENNNVLFSEKELKESYSINSDGTGLFYYDKDLKLPVIKKWTIGTDFKEIYEGIKNAERNTNAINITIHFRFGTSGGKAIDQIHPINISGNQYLFHNGIVNDFELSDTASDTQWIAYYLKENKFSIESLNDEKMLKAYSNIFKGNKLLIIENEKFKFVNEDLGNWKDGIWRSWNKNSCYGFEQDKTEFFGLNDKYYDSFFEKDDFCPFNSNNKEENNEIENITGKVDIFEKIQCLLDDGYSVIDESFLFYQKALDLVNENDSGHQNLLEVKEILNSLINNTASIMNDTLETQHLMGEVIDDVKLFSKESSREY